MQRKPKKVVRPPVKIDTPKSFEVELPFNINVPYEEPAKTSSKKNGSVEAYAANTNKGLSSSFNCDRISIVTNLFPPKNRKS